MRRAITNFGAEAELTVWDSPEPPPRGGLVYAWRGHGEDGKAESILAYVETHSDALRRRYLAWVRDLGQAEVSGRRVVDHLALEDGLSFWWMTLLAEQSPWMTPSISDALRLLALDEMVARDRPSRLRLVSGNPALHETMTDLCTRIGIPYEWHRLSKAAAPARRLPTLLRSMLTLLKIVLLRWPLRRVRKPAWTSGDRAVLLCSHFIYMDPSLAGRGVFSSRYWTELPKLFRELGLSANWLHLYQSGDVVPNPRVAAGWAEGFNRAPREQGNHYFTESYVTAGALLRTLRRWARLLPLSVRLRSIQEAFRPEGASVSLWPMLRGDWYASLRGPDAVSRLLAVELFDRALADLPRQGTGLFLYENQGWEKALIHAWRKHGHGRLIGVAHSTVRFWDLRYFSDPRPYPTPYPKPEPDLLALNGEAATAACSDLAPVGVPTISCEALRYLSLGRLRVERAKRPDAGRPPRVLVLTDYVPACTRKMLELLAEAYPRLARPVEFRLRTHPKCPVDPADYPTLRIHSSPETFAGAAEGCVAAYVSNMTSAAVDAYLAGLPLAVMLDSNELNFSPMRGRRGVTFVATGAALATALESSAEAEGPVPEVDDFFYFDPDLPRWRALLMGSSPEAAPPPARSTHGGKPPTSESWNCAG